MGSNALLAQVGALGGTVHPALGAVPPVHPIVIARRLFLQHTCDLITACPKPTPCPLWVIQPLWVVRTSDHLGFPTSCESCYRLPRCLCPGWSPPPKACPSHTLRSTVCIHSHITSLLQPASFLIPCMTRSFRRAAWVRNRPIHASSPVLLPAQPLRQLRNSIPFNPHGGFLRWVL